MAKDSAARIELGKNPQASKEYICTFIYIYIHTLPFPKIEKIFKRNYYFFFFSFKKLFLLVLCIKMYALN